MICLKKLNNVECCRFKTNKLFCLDQKSRFKLFKWLFMNIIVECHILTKTSKNVSKITKNDIKWPLFNIILHFPTFLKRYLFLEYQNESQIILNNFLIELFALA